MHGATSGVPRSGDRRPHPLCLSLPNPEPRTLNPPPMPFRVSREIDFCYGHRLLNYDGKCKYLHGHNGHAVITIESAALDERGMVLDFTDIKRVVSAWIDEKLDHRMLLHKTDPFVSILQQQDRKSTRLNSSHGYIS